jgi:TPR repeat protein
VRGACGRLAAAQFAVGVCYRDGSGTETDAGRAAEWLRRAADQGMKEAQYRCDGPGSVCVCVCVCVFMFVCLFVCLFVCVCGAGQVRRAGWRRVQRVQ